MQGEDPRREDKLLEALEAAEETVNRILARLLGTSAGNYSVIVSLEYDEGGPRRLVFDVEARRARMKAEELGEVLDAAIEEAVRVFEEKAGIRVGRKVRRRGPRRR